MRLKKGRGDRRKTSRDMERPPSGGNHEPVVGDGRKEGTARAELGPMKAWGWSQSQRCPSVPELP